MRNGNAHRVKEITMTTTMRIHNSNTGEIWERETTGLVCLNIIGFLYKVLECTDYAEADFDDFVDSVSDALEKVDRTNSAEPCSAGLTFAITNYKHNRYETYRVEAERA